MSNVRKNGTVKFYNESKGYGFVIDDQSGEDIFVHANGLKTNVSIKQDDRISYEVETTKKGLNAINVGME
jgi:cold shock protein